jgi:glycerol-3-phosphate acyltransferase PlsY
MEPMIIIITILFSYLLGAISFGRIFMKILKPEEKLDKVEINFPGINEPYRLESVGGNTASMKLGGRWGCLVGFLDILKAFIPTLIMRLLYPEQPYFLVSAVAALVGHNWPVYYRFKGGRGISPFYGGLFGFDPIGGIAVAFLSMVIGMVVLKELVFAYVGGVLLVIPWLLITRFNDPLYIYYILYAVVINILFIVAMVPEIRQIISLRKKYGKGDMKASMTAFPMGQAMLKMMHKLGLEKGEREPNGK